jgi:predicted RNA binding protein YcfA (HicA-like mRNA interferase family)
MAERQGKSSEARTTPKGLDHCLSEGSHVKLHHPDYGNYMFGFHDNEEIGHRMLARIAKHTGLTPDDL